MVKPKQQRQKKIKLAKHNRRTKWAPVWIVVRKVGTGKKVHPASITRVRRNWRTRKLKIKPRIDRKRHLG
ncbi:hypothetical protein J4477_02830 [Candidatus Pacearchaeota archaeon]|nr:hypothetical protein [Candidatus Pacearchaeota archaeon]